MFDRATQSYSCCKQPLHSQGCSERSLRKPGDLAQAEMSLQFALNSLIALQKSAVVCVVVGCVSYSDRAAIDEQLLRCKNLWTAREHQKQLDQELAEAMEQSAQAQVDVQKVLEQKRQEELKAEQEKRQKREQIERIAAEEKRRLQASLASLASIETARVEKPAKPRAHRTVTRNRGASSKYDDEIIESSESDSTDDNGEMSEEETSGKKNVFEDAGSDEEEEKKAKKRVRAVDSSDEEEEKRSRVEESSQKEVEDSNQEVAASIQKEVDDVFSDDD